MSLRLRKSLAAGVIVAGAFSFAGVMVPAAAHAQEFVSASVEGVEEERDVPDEVLGEELENTNAEVLAETAERGLAFTGTDAAGLGLLGAASIAVGATALAARRRNADAKA